MFPKLLKSKKCRFFDVRFYYTWYSSCCKGTTKRCKELGMTHHHTYCKFDLDHDVRLFLTKPQYNILTAAPCYNVPVVSCTLTCNRMAERKTGSSCLSTRHKATRCKPGQFGLRNEAFRPAPFSPPLPPTPPLGATATDHILSPLPACPLFFFSSISSTHSPAERTEVRVVLGF